eukprot:15469499-Alexandrium_andersonii.AAC.1
MAASQSIRAHTCGNPQPKPIVWWHVCSRAPAQPSNFAVPACSIQLRCTMATSQCMRARTFWTHSAC